MKITSGATESQFILHAGISAAHEVVANSLSKLGGAKSSIPGNLNGGWIFAVHHASGTSYGATFDDYYKNSKGFDAAVEKWMKTPTLKVVNFSVTFEMDDI